MCVWYVYSLRFCIRASQNPGLFRSTAVSTQGESFDISRSDLWNRRVHASLSSVLQNFCAKARLEDIRWTASIWLIWAHVDFGTCVNQKLDVQNLQNPAQLGHIYAQIPHKSWYTSSAAVPKFYY